MSSKPRKSNYKIIMMQNAIPTGKIGGFMNR